MRKGQESEVHTFEGGMNTDDDLTVLKPNQYRWAVNATLSGVSSGSAGVLTNYDGCNRIFGVSEALGDMTIIFTTTITLSEYLPSDSPINLCKGPNDSTINNTDFSTYILNNRNFLVVFSIADNNCTELITLWALNDKFEVLPYFMIVYTAVSKLGLTKDTQISASFDYMTLYFTTGKSGIMSLDLTAIKKLYDSNFNLDILSTKKSLQWEIGYRSIRSGGGNFAIGAYQWCYYYFRKGGTQTAMSHPSELIGLMEYAYNYIPNSRSWREFYKHGLVGDAVSVIASSGGTSQHSVELEIPVDESYNTNKDFLRLYRIYYENQTATPKFRLVKEIGVKSLSATSQRDMSTGHSKAVYLITDIGTGTEVDSLEFVKKENSVSVSNVGTLAIKDDRLYAANVKMASSGSSVDILRSKIRLIDGPYWNFTTTWGSSEAGIFGNNLFYRNTVRGCNANVGRAFNWNWSGSVNSQGRANYLFHNPTVTASMGNIPENYIFNDIPNSDVYLYSGTTGDLAVTRYDDAAKYGSFGSFFNYRHCFRSAYYQSGEKYLFGWVAYFSDGSCSPVINTIDIQLSEDMVDYSFMWRTKMQTVYPVLCLKNLSNPSGTLQTLIDCGVVAVKLVRCRRSDVNYRCVSTVVGNFALYAANATKNPNGNNWAGDDNHGCPGWDITRTPQNLFSAEKGGYDTIIGSPLRLAPVLWAPLLCDGIFSTNRLRHKEDTFKDTYNVSGVVIFYSQDIRYLRDKYGEGYWTKHSLTTHVLLGLCTSDTFDCYVNSILPGDGASGRRGASYYASKAACYKIWAGESSGNSFWGGTTHINGSVSTLEHVEPFFTPRVVNRNFGTNDAQVYCGTMCFYDAAFGADDYGLGYIDRKSSIAELRVTQNSEDISLTSIRTTFAAITACAPLAWYTGHGDELGVKNTWYQPGNLFYYWHNNCTSMLATNCGILPDSIVAVIKTSKLIDPLSGSDATPKAIPQITIADNRIYHDEKGITNDDVWRNWLWIGSARHSPNYLASYSKGNSPVCADNGDLYVLGLVTGYYRSLNNFFTKYDGGTPKKWDGRDNVKPGCGMYLIRLVKQAAPNSEDDPFISCGNAVNPRDNVVKDGSILLVPRFGDTFFGTNVALTSCANGALYSSDKAYSSYYNSASTCVCFPYEARYNPYWRVTLNCQALSLHMPGWSTSAQTAPGYLQQYKERADACANMGWKAGAQNDYGKNVLDCFTECGAFTYSTVAESTDTKELRIGSNRILVSMSSNTNSSNSKLQFEEGKYIDVDVTYGNIERLFIFNGKLYFFQTNAFGVVHSMERSAVSDTGMGVVSIGKGDVLTGFDYVSTEYGCNRWNKMAIINNTLFFVDTKNEHVLMYDGKTIVDMFDKFKCSREKGNIDDESKISIGGDSRRILFYLNQKGAFVFNVELQCFESTINIHVPPDATYSSNGVITWKPESNSYAKTYPEIPVSQQIQFLNGLAHIYYITKGGQSTGISNVNTLDVLYTMFTNKGYQYKNVFTHYAPNKFFNDQKVYIDFSFNQNPTKNKIFETLIVNAGSNLILSQSNLLGVTNEALWDVAVKNSLQISGSMDWMFETIALRVPQVGYSGGMVVSNYQNYLYYLDVHPWRFRRFGDSYIMQITKPNTYQDVPDEKFSMSSIGSIATRLVATHLLVRAIYHTAKKNKTQFNLFSVQVNYVTDRRITF